MTSASHPSSISPHNASSRPRLIGLDFLRGIAVIAVILLHTDEWNGIETLPPGWTTLRECAGFGVPFFLAASFYLLAGKVSTHPQQSFPLRTRLSRLLVPYAVWSGIYLGYKIIRYGALGKLSVLQSLANNAGTILFVGGAGFHLYFLPLLIIGTLVFKLWADQPFLHKQGLVLVVFLIISLGLYEGLIQTGNTVQVASGTAFSGWLGTRATHPLLRPGLVYLAWAIRCLPYVIGAFVLYPLAKKRPLLSQPGATCMAWTLLFCGINLLGYQLLPPGLLEVLRGGVGVWLAIALSYHLKSHPLILSLGNCAFGIYLVHLLFLEVFQTVWIRVSPVTAKAPSLAALLGIVGLTFLCSWGVTHQLMRRRSLARWLFGV